MQTSTADRPPEADLLLEIGHVALARGFLREGLLIMDGLIELQPDEPHPRTGRALGLHISGRSGEAIEELGGILGRFPQAVFAKALLAVVHHRTGDARARDVALEVLAQDPPAFIAALLKEVLGEDLGDDDIDRRRTGRLGPDQGAEQEITTAYPPGMRGKPV